MYIDCEHLIIQSVSLHDCMCNCRPIENPNLSNRSYSHYSLGWELEMKKLKKNIFFWEKTKFFSCPNDLENIEVVHDSN